MYPDLIFGGLATKLLHTPGGVQLEDLQMQLRPAGHRVGDVVEVDGMIEDIPRGVGGIMGTHSMFLHMAKVKHSLSLSLFLISEDPWDGVAIGER